MTSDTTLRVLYPVASRNVTRHVTEETRRALGSKGSKRQSPQLSETPSHPRERSRADGIGCTISAAYWSRTTVLCPFGGREPRCLCWWCPEGSLSLVSVPCAARKKTDKTHVRNRHVAQRKRPTSATCEVGPLRALLGKMHVVDEWGNALDAYQYTTTPARPCSH